VRLLDSALALKRTVIHAYASHSAARSQTATGRSIARLVPFAAPEVVARPKGQCWIGPHSDVFAFGRLCLFALTGKADPDGGDRVLIPEPWQKLIDDCTAWVQSQRPAHFGIVLDRLGLLPGASEHIQRAERLAYEEAVAFHTAQLEQTPNDVDTLLNRGNAYFRQGDMERAVADFTRALELRPDAATYRRRGLARVRLQALDAAIADYDEALKLSPHDVEALVNRGLAHAQKNDHAKAISDFTEALRTTPRDEAVLFNRANSYYVLRDYDRAIADYSEVSSATSRASCNWSRTTSAPCGIAPWPTAT
jgi:tetratricopeptide (TPR) repeat protein